MSIFQGEVCLHGSGNFFCLMVVVGGGSFMMDYET